MYSGVATPRDKTSRYSGVAHPPGWWEPIDWAAVWAQRTAAFHGSGYMWADATAVPADEPS